MRRLRPSLSYANVMSTVAVFAAVTGGAFAVAAIPDGGGKISACYFKSGKTKGQVRLLVSGTKCRKGESKLSWNQQGPQGLAGQQGERGQAGSDAQFSGAAAGGDLTGTYPNPTLAPVEALRAVGPAPAAANCAGANPAIAQFCTAGPSGQNWHWQNSAGGYGPAAFFMDRSGVVHLQGGVEAIGPAGLPVFVLPPGYRPSSKRAFVVRDDGGPTPPFNYVEVLADGRITKPVNPASTPYLSLDGIDFRAEQ